jgi:hypothetical protein
LSLTYVPNYFDILPMYLVILALIPVLMGIAKLAGEAEGTLRGRSVRGRALGCGQSRPAQSARRALVGAALVLQSFWLAVGVLHRICVHSRLAARTADQSLAGRGSAVIILASVPVNWHKMFAIWPELLEISRDIKEFREKTQFGILRYIHFLALAYLAYAASGEKGWRLQGGGLWGGFVAIVRKVGQQSLAVFLGKPVIAQAIGIAEDMTGKMGLGWPYHPSWVMYNFIGFGCLIAVAYTTAWFKKQPWRQATKQPDQCANGSCRQARGG